MTRVLTEKPFEDLGGTHAIQTLFGSIYFLHRIGFQLGRVTAR